MGKSNQKNVIGLVINATELSAVEVSFSGAAHIVAFGRVSLPESLVSDGTITDPVQAAGILSRMLRAEGFSSAPIVVGVKNDNVLLRMASFPKVPEDKMRNAILLQAQQFIPIPIKELVLDYLPCEETQEGERPMVSVLLVGAKKAYVQDVVELIRQAGRELQEIDAALLALVRAALTTPQHPEQVEMLVDVDREAIGIAFVQNKTVLMTRTVALAQSFKELLAGEEIGEEQTAAMSKLLADDLRTSLAYFNNMRPGSTLNKVLLTGVLPKLETVAKELSDTLSLKAEVPHYYPQLSGMSDQDKLRYAACIALAMIEHGE